MAEPTMAEPTTTLKSPAHEVTAPEPVKRAWLYLVHFLGIGRESPSPIQIRAGTTLQIERGNPWPHLAADRSISASHARVSFSSGQGVIENRGAKNGTFIARPGAAGFERVTQKADLVHGTAIQLGRALFVYSESAPEMDPIFGRTELKGGTAVARHVCETQVRDAAISGVNLLITGPTGAGKDKLAHCYHEASATARNGASAAPAPLISINLSAYPPSLIESELFGHVANAFNGAKERVGDFECANGGTLFLDEIGELDHDLQVKLLRVLEDHEIRRVGANKAQPIDVRVVSATNIEPQQLVPPKFRSDLKYRLAGRWVRLPGVDERREEVLSFFRTYLPPDSLPLSLEAAITLQLRSWPGNVREIINCARAVLPPASSKEILPHHLSFLPQEDGPDTGHSGYRWPKLEEVSADWLLALMNEHGQVSKLASKSGWGKSTIDRYLQGFGIKQRGRSGKWFRG